MLRTVVLFLSSVLLALTAGRAFWLWVGEYPFDMPIELYVQLFQNLDRRTVGPVASMAVAGTVLAGASAMLHRRERAVFLLMLGAFGLGLAGNLVSVLANLPINEQIAAWNPRALPAGFEDVLRVWWHWHQVRLVLLLGAMCLALSASLARR